MRVGSWWRKCNSQQQWEEACGIAHKNYKFNKSKVNTFVHVINHSGVQQERCADYPYEGMYVRLVATGIASDTSVQDYT